MSQQDEGPQTPKKPRRQNQLFDLLKSKSKMLYKEARKQDFKCRAKMAAQLSNNKSFNSLTKHTTAKFLWMRVKYLTRRTKGKQFTSHEKLTALSIMQQSPESYPFLQRLLVLPSKMTINKMIGNLQIEAGVNPQIFNIIKLKVRNWKTDKRMCSIVFGEMPLEIGIKYSNKRDKINGFVELTEKTSNFADRALIFMLKGAVYNWEQPIAFYLSEGAPSGKQVAAMLKDIVAAVSETGLNPIAFVGNQSGSFQNAMKTLQNDTKRCQILAGEETDDAIHLNGHILSVVFDSSHLVKGVRNNFVTKDVIMNDGRSTWKDVVEVYTMDKKTQNPKLRLLRKLKDEDVIPEKIIKKKVGNCVRVFSKTVAAIMGYSTSLMNYTDGRLVSGTLKNTYKLVSFVDDLFDSGNGEHQGRKDTKRKFLRTPVTEDSAHHTFWEEAIQKIKDIKFIDNEGNLTDAPTLKNWVTTIESYQRLWRQLKSNKVYEMRPRYFNTDCVENFFKRVRECNCGNSPSCDTFVSTFKALLVTSFVDSKINSQAGLEVNKLQELFKQLNPNENQVEVKHAQSPDVLIRNEVDEESIPIQAAWLSLKTSRASVGRITRKILSKYKCRKCIQNFTAREKDTSHKDLKTIKKRQLYPSEDCMRHFGYIVQKSNEYLEQNAHKNCVLGQIKGNILNQYSFNFIQCETHRETALEWFLSIAIRLCIFDWCKKINNILKGRKVAKLEEINLPFMQGQALRKCKKRFRNKSVFK